MNRLENMRVNFENYSAAGVLNSLLNTVGVAEVLLHIKEYCENMESDFEFETDQANIKFVDDNIIILKK